MRLLLTLIILAALAYGIYRITGRYRAATGTTSERLVAAVRGSATVLWAYVLAAGGYAIELFSQGATLLGQPEAKDFIQEYLKPDHVGPALAAIGLITLIARLRTLGSDDKPLDEA